MLETRITSPQWIHSCRVKDDTRDFISVKEKIVTINEKNEILESRDNLRIIDKPQRRIWMTKEHLRTHGDKKESEALSSLDEYVIRDNDLQYEVKRLLGLGYMKQYVPFKKLCKSPYIYGADVSMESLVRLSYINNSKHRLLELTTGAYDHEQSVLGCHRINAITVICGLYVYTAVLNDFTRNNVDENGHRFTSDRDMMLGYAREALAPYIKNHNFILNMEVFENELDMVKYIFKAIHLHKTDFIGIWNIDYDMPSLIDRVSANGANLADIAHHPLIDQKYKFFHYKQDKRKTQHNVDKWHWNYNVGYTQFMDAMLTYARVRKTQTKEPKYTLEAISNKEIGKGKLSFGAESNDHYLMQSQHFMKYVAYNIADAILIQLMFMKTNDVAALLELTGSSPLQDFSKQTVMLKDQLYAYYLSIGRALGTSGTDINELHAKLLGRTGGTVLPPYLIKNVGLRAIQGHPEIETYAYANNYDIDYASIYPFTKISFGISKDTKLFTIVNPDISGKRNPAQIERLCGGIATPMENSVPLCHEFFRSPNYSEMEQLFVEHFQLKNKIISR